MNGFHLLFYIIARDKYLRLTRKFFTNKEMLPERSVAVSLIIILLRQKYIRLIGNRVLGKSQFHWSTHEDRQSQH